MPGRPLRLLLLEDSAADAALCLRTLEKAGLRVEAERVDHEAGFRARLAEGRYDLILCDHGVPGWSGSAALQVARQLRPEIPFILVTGSVGDETAVELIKQGASDYVLKESLIRLPRAVLRALEEKQMQSERRRNEEALRQSEEKFCRAFRSSPDSITINTLNEGRYVEVNDGFLRMTGFSREEVIGRTARELNVWVDPADRDRMLALLREHGRIRDFEFRFRAKSGETRLGLRSAEVIDLHGEPCIIGITRDITERKQLERRVYLLEKFEAIGQLAGGVAHDFNNMVGAILGWAELGLRKAEGSPALQDHFDKIQQQALRAADVTRQLLAFARRQILEPRNLNLNTAITDTLTLLGKTISERIRIEPSLAPNLSTIRADPAQIEQILMNLCLNARDAMPEGGVLRVCTATVEITDDYVRVHPYARRGHFVKLGVTDTGVGMDAETQKHIFEPFFTTKSADKGTGLGLPTVYGIVRQHNGFIHVYSEPGHGTEFHIYFPVVAAVAETLKPRENGPVRGGTETILVAEDHAGIREMVRANLEMLGYVPLVAQDGEEAVAVFEAHRDRIALLLLDVVMPKLNGPEVFARIHKLRAGLPVVFTTGYSAESELLVSVANVSGAVVLQKPYGLNALAARMRELLDRSP